MRNVKHGSGVLIRIASSRISLEAISRWLVGSSRIRKFASESIRLRQRDTSALTTAQIPDPFIYIVTGKKKCRQNIPDLRTGHIRVDHLRSLPSASFPYGADMMFLIVVADMHLAAKFHTARIRALQTH